ncbi:MAG: DUF2071 domain-containing protein [Byssovorax sp.]
MDRLSPLDRPPGRPAGFQRWRNLAFLHWEVPVESVQALLPPSLTVDTWEGKAYVGVVPFTMKDVSPWWSPSVPGISNFHELNVRTYVHKDGKEPGVWFFSLDAAATVAVVAARAGWHLPYFRASMELTIEDDLVTYTSHRLFAGDAPADLSLRYRIGESIGTAVPDTFEHFLAERYILYAKNGDRVDLGRVHHKPYPLHKAEVLSLSHTMLTANGLPQPDTAPLVLYSPGVDVDVYDLAPC